MPSASPRLGVPGPNGRSSLPVGDVWEAVERVYTHPKVQARLAQWGLGRGMVVASTDERRVPTLGRH